MGSFKEFSKTLPTVEVQNTGQFRVKIKSGDGELANVVVSITKLNFSPDDLKNIQVEMKMEVVRE